MRKKTKSTAIEPILAAELTLDAWILLLGTDKWENVLPNNCFPTDKQKGEYLSRIQSIDDAEFKKLVRSFLNKSGYYGLDGDRLVRVVESYGPAVVDAIQNDNFKTEFDRRSLPKNGPQWEGITWVLDLLPDRPRDAVAAIKAFIWAHMPYFTDQMFYGHKDAIDMIREKYNVVERYSCFMSYGGPDEAFAQKLYESLTQQGVEAFFFPLHAKPGSRLHRVMREGVNRYDRIILVCSKASLGRPGLLNELTETLQREARDGGQEYLIPIRLDDYMFTEWAPDDQQMAQAVRDRVVIDFSGSMNSPEKYDAALRKLVTALSRVGSTP